MQFVPTPPKPSKWGAARIIKEKDYESAKFSDMFYAEFLARSGVVTWDDVAGFIDYGVANLNNADFWARLFNNYTTEWTTYGISKIFNSTNIDPANAGKILSSSELSVDRAALILADTTFDLTRITDILYTMDGSRIVSIFSSSNISGDRVQSIMYKFVDRGMYDKVIDILTATATSDTITAASSYSGVVFRRSISISSGVTVSITDGPGVIVADTIENNGTIVSDWVMGAGGAAGASGAGAGGDGRGGIIILANTLKTGTISADGGDGGDGSTVADSGAGGDGGAGAFWIISGMPDHTTIRGGNGGGFDVSVTGAGNFNGGGGGGGYFYAGGDSAIASVYTFYSATTLIRTMFKAVIDYWIQNVLGKALTTAKTIPNLGGSGGGGGAADDTYAASGGGGGGGGQIIVYATTIYSGTITARGGNGGAAGAEGAYDSSGGGGAGGIIYIFYRNKAGTITTDVTYGVTPAAGADYVGTAATMGYAKEFKI